MALIACPECGEKISSFAKTCVHCGLPISEYKEFFRVGEVHENKYSFESGTDQTNITLEINKLNGKDAIKQIMKIQGETNASLAKKLDLSQQALWDRLNNKKIKDLSLTVFCEMAQALGYKVVLTPDDEDEQGDICGNKGQ